MPLPALPEGYQFVIRALDADTRVRVAIESTGAEAEVILTDYPDVGGVETDVQLVAAVEAAATALADTFTKSRTVQSWIETQFPEAVPE